MIRVPKRPLAIFDTKLVRYHIASLVLTIERIFSDAPWAQCGPARASNHQPLHLYLPHFVLKIHEDLLAMSPVLILSIGNLKIFKYFSLPLWDSGWLGDLWNCLSSLSRIFLTKYFHFSDALYCEQNCCET